MRAGYLIYPARPSSVFCFRLIIKNLKEVNMRKFVSLLLAVIFMFFCTGCSNTSDDKETSTFVGGDLFLGG